MYYCTVCSYVEKQCVQRHHHMIRADCSINFMQWFHTSDQNRGSQKVGLYIWRKGKKSVIAVVFIKKRIHIQAFLYSISEKCELVWKSPIFYFLEYEFSNRQNNGIFQCQTVFLILNSPFWRILVQCSHSIVVRCNKWHQRF